MIHFLGVCTIAHFANIMLKNISLELFSKKVQWGPYGRYKSVLSNYPSSSISTRRCCVISLSMVVISTFTKKNACITLKFIIWLSRSDGAGSVSAQPNSKIRFHLSFITPLATRKRGHLVSSQTISCRCIWKTYNHPNCTKDITKFIIPSTT